MWKYIVTWIIVFQTIGECPDPPDKYDEFGRRKLSPVEYTPSLGCYIYDTVSKQKEFDSRKDAIDFIRRGSDRKAAGIQPYAHGNLEEFKLDSIRLKK